MNPLASSKRIDISIHDVDIGTVLILDKQARAAHLSRSSYLKDLLNSVARDSEYNPYNRDRSVELLEKMMPILERNTQALEKFDEWMKQISSFHDDSIGSFGET